MSHIINVSVKNHVAKQTDKTVYVCGNDDFVINFDFDSEWDQYDVKTARFTYGGNYVDVVFTGNTCAVPIITNVWRFKVGVFAGDLSTTTPVLISASKSILCETGTPAAPTDDVYNQIIEVVNEAATASNEAKAAAEAVTPDDTTVDGKPWTSKHIVDILCPPIEETGNPVQCYPLEGYPLTVTASWEPVQEGSGDPSPDNIRPITGRSSVQIQACGENLFDIGKCELWASSAYGLSISIDGDTVKLAGTATKTGTKLEFRFLKTTQKMGAWSILPFVEKGSVVALRFNTSEKSIIVGVSLTSGTTYDIAFKVMCYLGSTAPTEYTPYTGTTKTLTLPETIYGGSVDNNGNGAKEWELLTFEGTENWITHNSGNYFQLEGVPTASTLHEGECSHYMYKYNYNILPKCLFVHGKSLFINKQLKEEFSTLDEFKSYLAAQYAAGTPVQIAYKLAEPTTFTATGGGELTGLDGLNNILTDADSVQVEGREDIKHTIKELQDALASVSED